MDPDELEDEEDVVEVSGQPKEERQQEKVKNNQYDEYAASLSSFLIFILPLDFTESVSYFPFNVFGAGCWERGVVIISLANTLCKS